MTRDEVYEQLVTSFHDRKLSRSERQELARGLGSVDSDEDRNDLRHRAFELVHAALSRPEDAELLYWLEDVVKTLYRPAPVPSEPVLSEAWFSPAQDCSRRLIQLIDSVSEVLDICVFTITDDRIADAVLRAHERQVPIRIITDDDKTADEGSDIERLRHAGIPIRVDRSPWHMHHKFALFDRIRLLTGSYNWTRSASRDNQENFIITGDQRLVAAFAKAFEALWERVHR